MVLCLDRQVLVLLVLVSCSEAAEGEEPVPVPYRFTLSPSRNGKCNVFKPNALSNSDSARQGCQVASR